MIEFSCFQSPIGLLSILAVREGVVKIFLSNQSCKELINWSHNHFGTGASEGTDFTTQARDQIVHYLGGIRKSLNFPILHFNSPFSKKVLEAQRKIPYGETRSYREIARMVNNPQAYRAVGSVSAKNPLPLYFPCHRIIHANGSMGGFGGGVKIKKWLLDLESRYIEYPITSS